LKQAAPDLAAVNAEWSFWKGLNDVLEQTLQRTQPQGPGLGRQLAETAGTAAGSMVGASAAGPVGAAGGALALGKLATLWRSATQSPQWRLASARAKNAVADAIVNGDLGQIAMALSRITSVGSSKLATP
jgi:hypothetical protein